MPERSHGGNHGEASFEEREVSLKWKVTSSIGVVVVLAVAMFGVFSVGPDAFGDGSGSASEPGAGGPDPTTPVVLIILDELPTASLMKTDQSIAANRFPNIARFVSESTWYRDNAAAGDFTAWAVPAILTGNHSNEQTLPTSGAQPDSIFSALGPGRRVHAHEEVTEICSKLFCPDGNQGEFPDEIDAGEFVKQKFGRVDIAEIKRWIDKMPAGGNTISVLHLLLPHAPHIFLPGGQVYPFGPLVHTIDGSRNDWTVSSAGISLVQQRHLIQAGYADRLVGNILSKVRRNGAWDRSMVIVTADHGHAFDVRYDRRDANPGSVGAILNPPLIIKYPHQAEGRISRKSTQSVDILPTIAEQLGVELPYTTDGRPISEVPVNRRLFADKNTMRTIEFTTMEIRSQRRAVLLQNKRRFGTGGLWKLGPKSKLIGSRPGRRQKLSGAGFSISSPKRLAAYRPGDHHPPSLVSGVVSGIREGQVLAMTMKGGRIVATTRSFRFDGAMRFGMMVPPPKLVRSTRRIKLFVVRPDGRLVRVGGG